MTAVANIVRQPRDYRKFFVAVATAASEAVVLGLVEGAAAKLVAIGLAVAGTYGVYRVPNAATPPA